MQKSRVKVKSEEVNSSNSGRRIKCSYHPLIKQVLLTTIHHLLLISYIWPTLVMSLVNHIFQVSPSGNLKVSSSPILLGFLWRWSQQFLLHHFFRLKSLAFLLGLITDTSFLLIHSIFAIWVRFKTKCFFFFVFCDYVELNGIEFWLFFIFFFDPLVHDLNESQYVSSKEQTFLCCVMSLRSFSL